MNSDFYNLKAEKPNGELLELSEYKGKVILIVNTASKCGFTYQYDGLEALYKKYQDNLIVLGFPCNQFKKQESGSDEEISSFCKLNFGVTFPLLKKSDVNGENTNEVFAYLKDKLPGLLGKKIKWNFTKFLIDQQGNPIKRFSPTTKPEKLESHIEKLIK